MSDGTGILRSVWRQVDDTLRAVDKKLRRTFRWLRIAQVGMIILLFALAAAALLPIWYPEYSAILYGVVLVVLAVALLVPLIVLVSLPLRLKSVMRLVHKGYPGNARELAIRAAARKLHDESIETEELLMDTAVNEGKKAVRKYKERLAEAERAAALHRDDPPGDGGRSRHEAPGDGRGSRQD